MGGGGGKHPNRATFRPLTSDLTSLRFGRFACPSGTYLPPAISTSFRFDSLDCLSASRIPTSDLRPPTSDLRPPTSDLRFDFAPLRLSASRIPTSDLRPLTSRSDRRSPFQRDPLLRCASSAERNTGPMKSPSSAKIRLDHRPHAPVASSQSRVRFGGAIVVLVLGRAGAASAKRCTSNPGMFRTMLRSPRKSQVAGTPTWSDISRASR